MKSNFISFKKTLENCVNSYDAVFFLPLGAASSLAMWGAELLELPSHMSRGLLLSLITDNVAFNSLGLLVIAIFFIHLFRISFLKNGETPSKLLLHLCKRCRDFSSPAFFILIGASIPIVFRFLLTLNTILIIYVFALLWASLVFLYLALLANLCLTISIDKTKRWSRAFVIGMLVFVTLSIPVTFYFDERAIPVVVGYDLGYHQQLEVIARERNMTVPELVHSLSIDGINKNMENERER